MPRIILLFVLTLSFSSSVGSSIIPSRTRQFKTISLPLRFCNSLPYITVMVQEHGPFLFAIDTGSTAKVSVDTRLSKQLSLHPTGTISLDDTTGRNTRIHAATRLKTISIGHQEFRDVNASIMDLNQDNSMPQIDGMLGFRLFEDYLLTLDYPQQKFYLEYGKLEKANGKTILPLKQIQSLPAIDITVQGQKVTALIDSGNVAPGIVIGAPLAPKLFYTIYDGSIVSARSFCNIYKFSEAKLKTNIIVGQYLISNPIILRSPDYIYNNLGSVFLKDFVVTFDQKNHLVRIDEKYITNSNSH
jgi:Aspartyl protease